MINNPDWILEEETSLDEPLNIREETGVKDSGDYPVHFNLRMLSHSAITGLLHACPRKFEINRMSKRAYDDDEAGHLAFGTVVGNGVQEYLITGNLNRAIFRAFMDWNDSLDEMKAEKKGKTFWHAVRAIQLFEGFRKTALSEYELVWNDGIPACELGFDLDLGEGFHYRGKLDALLRNQRTKKLLVFECKTTGMNFVNEAMYKNSSQALGYGLIIDTLAGQWEEENDYDVLYPVYKTNSFEWEAMRFPKSNVARASWLQSILLDVRNISIYSSLEYFPMFGESCMAFNRQCQYFDTCTLSNETLGITDPFIKPDKEGEYPFKFDILQLIETQRGKL
jgi:hypothetical protein